MKPTYLIHGLSAILLLATYPAFALDPVGAFNNAIQLQLNGQIQRSVADAFRSVARPSAGVRPSNIEIRDARPDEVVLYTTQTCSYCTQARAHLQSRHIPYLEKDVSSNPQANAEWAALGGRGVPLAIIGNQKLTGFSAASYDVAYTKFQAGHPVAMATNSNGEIAGESFAAGEVLVARIARVKLLASAAANARALGQLGKGEEVNYLGETQHIWLKVKSTEAEGWVERALVGKP